MTKNPTVGIARIDQDGQIRHLNQEARAILGACEGFGCSTALRARDRDGHSVCDGCFLGGTLDDTRHHGEVTVRDRHVRLTCSPVGQETVVIIEPVALNVSNWNEPLTKREREVLSLVARGLTTPIIARRLGVQPATIRTHVEHAREKLGAGTRAQAVARALATGQIT